MERRAEELVVTRDVTTSCGIKAFTFLFRTERERWVLVYSFYLMMHAAYKQDEEEEENDENPQHSVGNV